MHLLALLLACDPPTPDCGAPALSAGRLDLPTGYRALDIPVAADWLAEPREVPMGLWYPTDATDGDPARYMDAFEDPMSLEDAPFADPAPGCKLPLVVYSHGSQAWGGNASPLLRHLVAQGFVAAAPDHVGNTLADNVEPRPVSFSLTRVADIVATLDAIEALPEGDPLHDRVDTSRVVALGHSFGGQTAWLLAGPTLDAARLTERCADAPGCTDAELAAFAERHFDARITGVVPMDGFATTDLVAAEGWASAERPILYLAKAEDGDEVPFTTAAAAGPTWVRFDGACHETFTATTMPCATFDKEEGLDAVAAYLTAFTASEGLGQGGQEPWASLLDGSTVVDDRLTVFLPGSDAR